MPVYRFTTDDPLPTLSEKAELQFTGADNIALLAKLCSLSRHQVRARLSNDNNAYIAWHNGLPVAFGWSASGRATIGELSHTFTIPTRHRYLWNFRTLETHRGMGIYPRLLQYILTQEKAEAFWIIHAPENNSSLNGIVRAGFQKVGQLLIGPALQPEITLTTNDASALHALTYMDFTIADTEANSCWNCNSPFLKKRMPDCCCTPRQQQCRNPMLISLN